MNADKSWDVWIMLSLEKDELQSIWKKIQDENRGENLVFPVKILSFSMTILKDYKISNCYRSLKRVLLSSLCISHHWIQKKYRIFTKCFLHFCSLCLVKKPEYYLQFCFVIVCIPCICGKTYGELFRLQKKGCTMGKSEAI